MTEWKECKCKCDECYHRWVGGVPFNENGIPVPVLECPSCHEMYGRVEESFGSLGGLIGEKGELEKELRKKTYEELVGFAVLQGGLLGNFAGGTRRLYQEQKELLGKIIIKEVYIDDIGAYRIDIKQDSETKQLIGRLQIHHRADDIEWDDFCETIL